MKARYIMLTGLLVLGTNILNPLTSHAAENTIQEVTETIANSQNIEVPPTEVKDLIKNFTEQTSHTVEQKMRAGKTVSFNRGSALMWSKDIISFNYSGGGVTSSSGRQEVGWVFPNIVRKKGISRYSTTNSTHKWRGQKTIGAGTVTPWGDIKIYNYDYTDHYGVHSNGDSSWY